MLLTVILSLLLIVASLTFLSLLVSGVLGCLYLIAFMMTTPPRGENLAFGQVQELRFGLGSRATLHQGHGYGDYVELDASEPTDDETNDVGRAEGVDAEKTGRTTSGSGEAVERVESDLGHTRGRQGDMKNGVDDQAESGDAEKTGPGPEILLGE